MEKIYGFKIYFKQKYGTYYYIIWTNLYKNIMVIYDEQVEIPLTIRIYDANSFGFDAIEFKKEFAQKNGTPQEKIHCAAEWLRGAVENKNIITLL